MGVLRVIGGSVHAASSMVAENQDLFPSRPALALKTLPIALHAPHLETKTLAAGNSEEDTWHVDRHQQQDLTEAGTDRKTEECFLTHYKPTGRRAHPPPLQPGAAKTTDLPADPPTRTACSVPPR